VHFTQSVSGKNVAGSTFNISNVRVTGSATTNGGRMGIRILDATQTLSAYDKVEASYIDVSGVSLSSSAGEVDVILIIVNQPLTLWSTGGSIVWRNNSVKGMSVTSSTSYVRVYLWHPPWGGSQQISGVAKLTSSMVSTVGM
jgi:hypothetical protein